MFSFNVNFSGGGASLNFSFGGTPSRIGPSASTFPEDLASGGHNFIVFRALKDFKVMRASANRTSSVASIYLPVPANLSTAYNAQYSNEGIGPFGFEAAKGGDVAARLTELFDRESAGKSDLYGAFGNAAQSAAETSVGGLVGGAIGGAPGAASVSYTHLTLPTNREV